MILKEGTLWTLAVVAIYPVEVDGSAWGVADILRGVLPYFVKK